MSETEIRTARLILRRASEADPAALNAAVQDPRIYRNVGTVPAAQTLEQTLLQQAQRAARSAEGKGGGFCAYLDGELIGLAGGGENDETGIVDFGYWILPSHWGRGFATEASFAVLRWFVHEQGRTAFTASHIIDNASSGRVLVKLGFRPVGQSRHFCAGRAGEVDAIDFVWPASPEILTQLQEPDHG